MKAYFDTKEGIGYNFGRTHMNSCDFSLNIYANVTDGDKTLQSFNIERYKKYIIPFLKDAMAYCDDDIILFASPWSPPSYMKDNNSMVKGGSLLQEYKKLWAHCYAKYVQAYAEELNKPTICTEICAPIAATKSLISLAERYGREICENLNNYNIATCDWNLLLNGYGGPYHNRSTSGGEPAVTFKDHKAGCYAPIMYYEKEHRMEITPIYYYIGHFSKYIKRGARRIATTKYTDKLSVCAFINPNGEKVAVIMNISDEELPAVIRLNGKCTRMITEAHSIMTILF